jgi:hypothetical protein
MDTSAHGQRKGQYRNYGFECYTIFEAQEDTPTPGSPDICLSDFFFLAGEKEGWNNNLRTQTNFLRPSMNCSADFQLIRLKTCFETGFIDWYQSLYQMVTTFSEDSPILLRFVWDGPKMVSVNTYETSCRSRSTIRRELREVEQKELRNRWR